MANVILTGANQGIGYFLAEQLLQDGHRVAVLDVDTDRLEPLSQAFPARFLSYRVDVCAEEEMRAAVKAAVEAFSSVDAAIHNACFCPFGKEEDTDLSVYAQAFRVNYYGGLRLAKCVLPYMREKQRGRVLFTSSGVGVTGFPGLSPYASTKGALESLAKCLRLEYASQGISFHVIHPPLTRTRSAAPLPVPPAFMADPETVGRRLARRIFANRFILCPSLGQKLQTLACYCFPLKMGGLLAKMTARCASMEET